LERSLEVGVRKALGAPRSQLVRQFLLESVLVNALAAVLALGLVVLFQGRFSTLAGVSASLRLVDHPMLTGLVPAVFLIGALLSGLYPALFLSSFQPVRVLKGTFKAGRYASVPRKVLVVLQFTVSIVLVIGTTIVWQQIQYAKDRPIGYSREGLIMVRKTAPEHWNDPETLRQELLASEGAVGVAESAAPPTAVWFENSGFNWRGKDPNMHDDFMNLSVTHDYGRTMGWEFVQGRDFSREHSTDSSAIVLNEAAVKYMGLTDPVDEEITWQGQQFHVIGVIKDMIITSPYEPVKQGIFRLLGNQGLWINVRLNPDLGTSTAISKVEGVFQKLIPAVPFEYTFIDQEYALKFAGEERIGKLASFFASLAIFISCLGLFGMASFVAEQRKKEIGIRKILGASITNLWGMLSREFMILVGISCLIGIPIAWNYLAGWLDNYYYHTAISIWVFVSVSVGALFITLATVSFQTIRAAVVNPISSLRSE
jgi:hypothetical protein